MAREEVASSDRVGFLELLTMEHEGSYVTMEILTKDFGDQHEAERLPFVYMEYDYKDDVVIVAVGGRDGRNPVVLRHLISEPEKIFVHPPRPEPAHAVDVIDKDGVHTVVSMYPNEMASGS